MRPSLSVLHVIHSGAVGGGPRVVLSLIRHVPGRHAVATNRDGPLLDEAGAAGAEAFPLTHTGEFSFALSIPPLARIVARYDLVHLHGQFAGFYGTLAAALAGKPAIYTAHFPSFLTDSSLKTRARNHIAELIPTRLSRITVSCSRTIEAEYIRRKLLPASRILTIYNGVSTEAAGEPRDELRRELCLGSDPVILALGRLTDQKGFDVLLEAFPAVRRATGASLLIAGDGPWRRRLQLQAEHLGVAQSVHFLGFRSDTEDLLHLADVVAMPSRFEAFPLVALEAMMAAKPVVSSDLSVLTEALGDAGITVRLEPEVLAAALVRVLATPGLAEQLGAHGALRARRNFTAERMAREYDNLYHRVLEGA